MRSDLSPCMLSGRRSVMSHERSNIDDAVHPKGLRRSVRDEHPRARARLDEGNERLDAFLIERIERLIQKLKRGAAREDEG